MRWRLPQNFLGQPAVCQDCRGRKFWSFDGQSDLSSLPNSMPRKFQISESGLDDISEEKFLQSLFTCSASFILPRACKVSPKLRWAAAS